MGSGEPHGWLVDDNQVVADLPEWARASVPDAVPRIVMTERGLVVTAWGKGTAAPWEQVLGVTMVGERAHVLVPRRPPHPPWLEVTPDLLPEGMDLPALVDQIRSRISERGYRQQATHYTETLSRAEVEERILARDAVRGALEIPMLWRGPKGWQRALLAVLAFAGGIYAGFFGGMLLFGMLGAVTGNPEAISLVWIVALATGMTGAGLALGYGRDRRKRPPRVLALTPDGCVCGFPDGVRAFTWDEIDRFELNDDPRTIQHSRILTVVGQDGSAVGRIDTRWLDAPADTVVAVANEYRKRHRPAPQRP